MTGKWETNPATAGPEMSLRDDRGCAPRLVMGPGGEARYCTGAGVIPFWLMSGAGLVVEAAGGGVVAAGGGVLPTGVVPSPGPLKYWKKSDVGDRTMVVPVWAPMASA